MSWYVLDALDRAIERTRKCLFEPFDFWKWMRLAVIVLLLGGLGSSGGNGSNYSYGESDMGPFSDVPAGIAGPLQGIYNMYSANAFEIIAGLILFFIVIILLFSYISSVMEFVFVESLVKNEVRFREYSRRYLGKGFGLFLFRLILGLLMLAIIAAIVMSFLYPAMAGSADVSNIPDSSIVAFVLVLLAVILVLALIIGLVNSLIGLSIPVALYTNNNIFRAFSMVLRKFRQDAGQIVLYWIGRMILGIAAAIVVGILALIVIVAALLIVLVVDGLVYLTITSLLPGSMLVWIVLAPLILVQFILFILALAFISVPAQVFLRYHLITFLQAWYPEIAIPVFDGLAGTGKEDVL
ncbi:DUF7544 domain-containing protein [Methanolobus chelungpuianus]|uniref:DUF7544 domain-containing protein n=1 Tax=Methanolobus chelungpuianus TaxID=502115 RepID=UPI002115556A|nr:hypothetical protein [Methanolobus chelungpuianus]